MPQNVRVKNCAGKASGCLPPEWLSTVNGRADSARDNPHLFNKLAKALRDEGKPHPSIIESWKGR